MGAIDGKEGLGMEKRVVQPRRLRLPIPITKDLGLGDVLKRTTSALGIKPCGGCEGRAAALNRLLVISSRKSEVGG